MNFTTNELTQQVAQTAKDFALQHIKPHLMEWDESQEFPLHIFKKMGKLGLMGVLVPEEYGGSGLGYFLDDNAILQISQATAAIFLRHQYAHQSQFTHFFKNV